MIHPIANPNNRKHPQSNIVKQKYIHSNEKNMYIFFLK